MIFLNQYCLPNIRMSEFLFYKRYNVGRKDTCRYCGKRPVFICTNPGFHYGYTACYECVDNGPCTPHFRALETYDIGNMTYHIGHGAHDKGHLVSCHWCRAENHAFEEKAVEAVEAVKAAPVKPVKRRRADDAEDADYKPPVKRAKPEPIVIKFPATNPVIQWSDFGFDVGFDVGLDSGFGFEYI